MISHKEFPVSELLDYGLLIFQSGTRTNCEGSALGVCDKWRLADGVSRLNAIKKKTSVLEYNSELFVCLNGGDAC